MLTAEEIINNKILEMKPEWEKLDMLEFLYRIKDMYLREVEYIKNIQNQSKLFDNQSDLLKNLIKKLSFKNEFSELRIYNDCLTEEDIANRAIKNVNNVYNSIFDNNKLKPH